MTTYKLMVKEHSLTGLKYLCVTKRKNWESYTGSGVYWKQHLKKHGKIFTTVLLFETDNLEHLETECKYYSELYNVAESNEWANQIPELGYIGNMGNLPAWVNAADKDTLNKMRERAKVTRVNTCRERWGADSSLANTVIRQQISQTNIEKYGVSAPFNDPLRVKDFREKRKLTMLERYGYENNLQIPSVIEENKDKRKLTMLERYGVEYLTQDPLISQKVKTKREATLFAKYGVTNVSLVPEIVEKRAKSIKMAFDNSPVVECSYCNYTSKNKSVMTKFHNERCKSNPNYIAPDSPIYQCPYCEVSSTSLGNMKRWHFNNCKNKDILNES